MTAPAVVTPGRLGGILDAAASEKDAWFVNLCERFGVGLLVLVDTPGFLPGTAQERAGVIRHGASLVRAFACARPGARIGVMGGRQAVAALGCAR